MRGSATFQLTPGAKTHPSAPRILRGACGALKADEATFWSAHPSVSTGFREDAVFPPPRRRPGFLPWKAGGTKTGDRPPVWDRATRAPQVLPNLPPRPACSSLPVPAPTGSGGRATAAARGGGEEEPDGRFPPPSRCGAVRCGAKRSRGEVRPRGAG
ncbi:actin-related protein 2/3 complex subunit 5-like protein isoform X1 [Nannospalax galili]|uniref:actin-related protein 2/3 complex subunit 5-like protein isoform X1 n=1 Tax=Nannospalax galili TaxID=1026970 RepID=UPI00111C607E|nr:actin-related protein 2/3 complex subunit 5-like protein isoform X1 [Nannospalax galili]